MESCTITRNLQIVPGTRGDYETLSHYHYRESSVGPYAAIFAMKGKFRTAAQHYFDKAAIKNGVGILESIQPRLNTTQVQQNSAGETVGVIVYAMPAAGCQLRSAAPGGLFAGVD